MEICNIRVVKLWWSDNGIEVVVLLFEGNFGGLILVQREDFFGCEEIRIERYWIVCRGKIIKFNLEIIFFNVYGSRLR